MHGAQNKVWISGAHTVSLSNMPSQFFGVGGGGKGLWVGCGMDPFQVMYHL